MTRDLWSYQNDSYATAGQSLNLDGFDVEATDGKIGSVDEATYEVGGSYLIVDTGPWIFGKKVMLPASVVTQIDPQQKQVFVSRTKEEIKNAPEFDASTFKEAEYRDRLGDYYGRFPYTGTGTM